MWAQLWEIIDLYVQEYQLVSVAVVFLFFVFLERFLALRESKFTRRGWLLDMVYLLVNPMFIKEGMIGVMFAWGHKAGAQELLPGSFRLTVSELPLWLAIPLAVLIGDLGFYLAHRMFHSVPWLWPFHEVHHSSEHLDALAAVRVHPVDQIVTKLFSLVPLFALGFSGPAIFGFSLIYLVQSFYVHSNLKGSWGPFRLALATPEFHHWHHADHKEAYDKNFSGQLPLWDLVFGTLHMPVGTWPQKYGLTRPIKEGYHWQLIHPFIRIANRFKRKKKKSAQKPKSAAEVETRSAATSETTADPARVPLQEAG